MNEKEEKKIIEKVLLASVNEYKRARRWRIFFTLLFFAYIIFITVTINSPRSNIIGKNVVEPHVAVIEIQTPIMSPTVTKSILSELDRACENDKAKAVFLSINSPGGTTYQSRVIYKELLFWREKLSGKKKIYAVIEDVGASGAYLIASASDKIYAGETSLVGSIGTAISSFGAVELIHKIGVERRLITSGNLKGMFDPFEPVSHEEKSILENMAGQGHNIFIDDVVRGREGKIKDPNNKDLYSGRVWLGKDALELGLIDEIGYVSMIARKEFDNIPTVLYKKRSSFLDEIKGMNIKLSHVWNNFSNTINLLSTV